MFTGLVTDVGRVHDVDAEALQETAVAQIVDRDFRGVEV